jgi:hypothetical protein
MMRPVNFDRTVSWSENIRSNQSVCFATEPRAVGVVSKLDLPSVFVRVSSCDFVDRPLYAVKKE